MAQRPLVERVESLEETTESLRELPARVDRIESRLESVKGRLESVEGRRVFVERRVGSVEGHVVQLRREMRDGFSEMKLLIREGDEATRNELRTEMRALNE
jgi:predicted nuclease with TOPRIM domain